MPLCPYFGQCGGCTSQHIEYPVQLEGKKRALISAIRFDDVKAFFGSPYHYRNRMDFIFHPNGLGFRKKGKWWQIVDIKDCAISNEKLNILLKELRDYFKDIDAFDVKKHSGTFRYAVIRTPSDDSSISFVLNSDSMKISMAVDRIKQFAAKTTAKNVVVTYVPSNSDLSISSDYFVIKGHDFLKETILGRTFTYSVQGFYQNNSGMAEKMHGYVNELVKNYGAGKMHLLDLYAGVGTFGIINSGNFITTAIVESDKGCIDAAKKNIELNKVKNAKALVLDAMQLKKLDLPKPLFVITDPPRTGMHPKTIEQLNVLKPEVIIYISCNVQQLAKELAKLKDYKIKSAALFDLFPQTPHSEAVVELNRNIQDCGLEVSAP